MSINEEILDELLKDVPLEEIFSQNGLMRQLTKRLAERALQAEMSYHLGYDKYDVKGKNSGNARNGSTRKTVRSPDGQMELEIPRDRNGTFEPQLVQKNQRQLNGFDERILSLYARGMTTRDIQAHFEEVYGVEVSAGFISQVINEVAEEIRGWQNRSLDAVYPIVYLDALFFKSRETGAVQNRAVYLALGINLSGEKELLGLWVAQTEGAKFWLQVMNELKNRGVNDILIACVDGLKGFPEAIAAVYPQTQIQRCIVHQVRYCLQFVSWRHRKEGAQDLKQIYGASTQSQAEQALVTFAAKWDEIYPTISQSWRNNWEQLSLFFAYPPQIRKVIYTTNAIESLNASLRKISKTRRAFPNDEAILKLLYLSLHQIAKKWTMPIHDWKQALTQFMIMFGDRVPV